MGGWTALEWLALVEYELLLFAGVFFLVGSLDELAVDLCWMWLVLGGKLQRLRLDRRGLGVVALKGRAAVLIPAWHEHRVIGQTVAHALASWRQADLRIYVGIYRNDPATLQAAMAAARGDERLRLVVHDAEGPTTKADCLNRLYRAIEQDEHRESVRVRMLVLHDAEDMVDAAALALLDGAMDRAEFVQLPVLALPQPHSRWIGSHYSEEFAEAHAKTMVVRDALGTALPAAGVGCAFDREIIARMMRATNAQGPFSTDSLAEDYELGMRIQEHGGRSRFLRVRGDDGALVATRAWFPSRLSDAVRQKARWVHGIAFQGWDRLGWKAGAAETWMRLRDRRGPLSALVLAAGYALFMLVGLSTILGLAGFAPRLEPSPVLFWLVLLNLVSLCWRAAMRFGFAAHEYGWAEGFRAVLRIPVANVIAIMASRRALARYAFSLRGSVAGWEKTAHDRHPAELHGQLADAEAS